MPPFGGRMVPTRGCSASSSISGGASAQSVSSLGFPLPFSPRGQRQVIEGRREGPAQGIYFVGIDYLGVEGGNPV